MVWNRVYGWIMDGSDQTDHAHRRPPADRLFCRGDGPHAAKPDIALGARAQFAERFAREFAEALSETRRTLAAS